MRRAASGSPECHRMTHFAQSELLWTRFAAYVSTAMRIAPNSFAVIVNQTGAAAGSSQRDHMFKFSAAKLGGLLNTQLFM